MNKYLVLIITLLSVAANAKDPSQWSTDPTISKWYRELMQPDDPYKSCCGEADSFEADTFEVLGDQYVAVITDGKDIIPNGTRLVVPNAKINTRSPNPTGHGIIFIGAGGQIYCYAPPTHL